MILRNWSLAIVLLLPCVGCGLSDYESRMAASLAELQEKTRYESLFGPSKIDRVVGKAGEEELIELPVTIRLPKAFGANDWFRPDSVYRYRNEQVPDDVLYPPFLGEFPGLNRTGEAYAEAEERTFLAYYFYVGVVESRTKKFEAVLADLRKKTASKLKNTSPWQDVECKDEHLVPTKWKMLEAKGLQDFLNRSEQISGVPGTFRVYAREDQGYIILLGVRIPNSLLDKVTLLDLADAIAGTVQVTAPAPKEAESLPDDEATTPAAPETPAEDAPADAAQPEGTPKETPATTDDPAVKDPPVDDPAPADQPATGDAPAEDPAGEAPAADAPAEGQPAEEAPAEETDQPAENP